VTSFTYDASGNLLEKTETGYSGGDPVTRTTTNTYNGLGQITMIDGPRTDVADVTTFEYYPNDPSEGLNRGMLKKITDALGGETLFSQYNAFGKPEQSIDANGVVTTYVYDAAGRLTSRTTAGHTTSFDYDGAGNLTAVYLPNGSSITYTYTDADLLEKIEDNLGNYIEYFYDTEGNRTREEIHDQNGLLKKFVDFEFDDFNRLKKTIYPDASFEERTYDDNGNLTGVTDASTNATLYDYDALNRLTTVTQPGDVITGYGYDSHDNLVTVTDAESHSTSYVYDDLGRLVSTTSPRRSRPVGVYHVAGYWSDFLHLRSRW
jgi:YD repeat-containing protein